MLAHDKVKIIPFTPPFDYNCSLVKMNLLYIIGNGFDINLGLKTGYQDFYNFYKDVESKDPDILAMKECIEKDRYSTWSDLEAGLGQYSELLDNPDVFTKCLTDIKQCLNQYLSIQYEARNFAPDYKKLTQDLYHPDYYLNESVANEYARFCNSHNPDFLNHVEISIVSFNYTNTLEDIYASQFIPPFRILHIHGLLSDDIVMGVSDLEQISNVLFRDSRDVREEFIKPDYNDACLNARNSSFEGWIDSADIIILFGSSLGETDRKWWRLIGKRMLDKDNPAAILYFPYDKEKDTNLHPNYRRRWTEGYQKIVLRTLEIPEDQSDEVLGRIFIGINRGIFNLPKSK